MFAYRTLFTAQELIDMSEPVVDPVSKTSSENLDLYRAEHTVKVSASPTGYVFQCPARSLFWQFDYTKLTSGEDILYLTVNNMGQYVTIWGSDLLASKDGRATALTRNNATTLRPILVIAIGAQTNDYHVVMNADCTFLTPIPGAVQAEAGLQSDTIFAGVPSLVPMINKHWAKTKLYRGLKTNDCLTALEQQLDLLTSFVMAMVPPEMVAGFQETSVLSVKSKEQVFAELIAQKRIIRALQKTYLESE